MGEKGGKNKEVKCWIAASAERKKELKQLMMTGTKKNQEMGEVAQDPGKGYHHGCPNCKGRQNPDIHNTRPF